MNRNAVSQRPRVLVYERMDPTDGSIRWLQEQGFQLTLGRAMWESPYRRYSEEEIVSAALGHIAVMGASGARFTSGVIGQLPDLAYISKFGVGVETIDLEAATARGIQVSNTPEESEVSDVAEHTIGMILALRKRLLVWTPSYMRRAGWRPGHFADSIAGSTIGIIGLGHIGRAVARRLTSWDVRLLGYDPSPVALSKDVASMDLATLLRESDVVTLHASPSKNNRHLIDRHALSQMKRGSVLINTARASLVDTDALCEALRHGVIAGAAIDVFDEEPPNPDSPLFELENVVVTPHVAAWTRKGLENIGWHAARNLVAMVFASGSADVVNSQCRARGEKQNA